MSVVEFALIVVSILGAVRCEFVQIPSNSEAVVGGQVELKCRAFDQTDIEWQHIAVGDTNSKIISRNNVITGEACRTRCSIEGSQTGELNLIITGVTLNDAGKYICMDTGTSQSVNAELVVFEAYPSPQWCATVSPSDGAVGLNSCGIEPDTVQLSCNMSYKGNLKPAMKWTSTDASFTPSNPKRSAVGEFITNSITVRTDDMRDSNYTCNIKYEKSDIVSKYSWTTSLRVFSNQTREVIITNCNSAETIDCAVSTGNSCTYSWTNNGSKETYSGSALNLGDVSNGLYICKAVCNVRGTTCSVEPVKVDYCSRNEEDDLSPGVIAAIVISIVLVTIIITIVVLIIFFRRRLAGDNNNDGTQQPNVDIQLRLIEAGESKDMPGGSGQTETPDDLTESSKPDILEDIREKEDRQHTKIEAEDAKSNHDQSMHITSPITTIQSQSDSGSDVDLSEFVVVNVNPDSIEEKVEHRFPKK